MKYLLYCLTRVALIPLNKRKTSLTISPGDSLLFNWGSPAGLGPSANLSNCQTSGGRLVLIPPRSCPNGSNTSGLQSSHQRALKGGYLLEIRAVSLSLRVSITSMLQTDFNGPLITLPSPLSFDFDVLIPALCPYTCLGGGKGRLYSRIKDG